MRDEYTREELGQGRRGTHFKAYQQGTNVVLLEPDIAKQFKTSEAVNKVLREWLDNQTKPVVNL